MIGMLFVKLPLVILNKYICGNVIYCDFIIHNTQLNESDAILQRDHGADAIDESP